MTDFFQKKIESIQTLGERLKKHREEKGWSKEKVARALNINVRYIKLFEEDKYNELPPDIYAINILRAYAGWLNLSPGTVSDIYLKEKKLFFKTRQRKAEMLVNGWQRLLSRILNPKMLKYAVIFFIFGGLMVYLGIAVNRIVSPPELFIESPADNFLTVEHQVQIIGKTEKEVQLKINNRLFLSDREGNFNLSLDLQKGLNIIKISAQKKYSKERVVYRKIMVGENGN